MKTTRVNVVQWAKEAGLEPLEVNGIPDGFIWKKPDITIGNVKTKGDYIIFLPLREWSVVKVPNDELLSRYDLLAIYNREMKYGKR